MANNGEGMALMKMFEQHVLSTFIWRPKTFRHHSCGDQKLSITNLVVIEFILVNIPKGANLSFKISFFHLS